jgi:hypothetical protein
MNRKVFDYKRPGVWIASSFFLFWGTVWTVGWTSFGLNASPIPVTSGSNATGEVIGHAPPWANFLVALIGVPIFIIGCSIALRAAQEKIIAEDGNLTYIDGQGKEKIRCSLSDVKSISLEIETLPRTGRSLVVGDQRLSRSPQQWRTYKVVTTEGEFKFYESIRDGRELFDLLKSAAQKYQEAHPEEKLPAPPDWF